MPRYLDDNGDKIKDVVVPKVWFLIPIEQGDSTTPINYDKCLIAENVVKYIEKLEEQLKDKKA